MFKHDIQATKANFEFSNIYQNSKSLLKFQSKFKVHAFIFIIHQATTANPI